MIRRVIQVVSAVLWLIGLVGYFTLPEDWPVAVERMDKIAMWFDRDALVILLLAASSVGFAWVTFAPTLSRLWRRYKSGPIQFHYGGDALSFGYDDEKPYLGWVMGISNETKNTLNAIEVHVLSITRVKRDTPHRVRRSLSLRNTLQTKFALAPGMRREIDVGRWWLPRLEDGIEELPPILYIGPFDGNAGDFLTENPGTYKLEIAVYGHDLSPIYETVGLSLSENGTTSFGRWREGGSWPYSMRVTVTERPEPQEPQDTPKETPQ